MSTKRTNVTVPPHSEKSVVANPVEVIKLIIWKVESVTTSNTSVYGFPHSRNTPARLARNRMMV
jgi:hypothetical protein